MSVSSMIGESYLRFRNWRVLILIVGVVFIFFQTKLEIRKWETVCGGDNCVEVVFSFSDASDFVPNLDEKKYRWIKLYKDGSNKIQYKRFFEYDNKATFSVEKGTYKIKTDLGEIEESIIVDEKREITLP